MENKRKCENIVNLRPIRRNQATKITGIWIADESLGAVWLVMSGYNTVLG